MDAIGVDSPMIALPKRVEDLSGRTYGRLTVLYPVAYIKTVTFYVCRCSCSSMSVVRGKNMKAGITQSCGCLRRERTLAVIQKHGRYRDRIYKMWKAMHQRCSNPNSTSYYKYGERGIFVCERWQSFENFVADVGEPPVGKTLDRIDNDGPYSPENCRWSTPKEQALNTRKFFGARKLAKDGMSLSLREWSDRLGIKLGTLYWRLERGWPVERVLSTETWGIQR